MSDCSFSKRLKAKTMTGEEWEATHAAHGQKTWEKLASAPEGYSLEWRCCPCGAKILTDKKKFTPGVEA